MPSANLQKNALQSHLSHPAIFLKICEKGVLQNRYWEGAGAPRLGRRAGVTGSHCLPQQECRGKATSATSHRRERMNTWLIARLGDSLSEFLASPPVSPELLQVSGAIGRTSTNQARTTRTQRGPRTQMATVFQKTESVSGKNKRHTRVRNSQRPHPQPIATPPFSMPSGMNLGTSSNRARRFHLH